MRDDFDGGPAFPRPGIEGMCGKQDGMSLRAWLAGKALAGLCAIEDAAQLDDDRVNEVADKVMHLADAVLVRLKAPWTGYAVDPPRMMIDAFKAAERKGFVGWASAVVAADGKDELTEVCRAWLAALPF